VFDKTDKFFIFNCYKRAHALVVSPTRIVLCDWWKARHLVCTWYTCDAQLTLSAGRYWPCVTDSTQQWYGNTTVVCGIWM